MTEENINIRSFIKSPVYLFQRVAVQAWMDTATLTHYSANTLSFLSWSTSKPVMRQCLSHLLRAKIIAKNTDKPVDYFIPLAGYQDLYCIVNVNKDKSGYKTYRVIPNGKNFVVIAYDANTKMVNHYSEHFFIRYCQRLHLTGKTAKEQLKHFIQNNSGTHVKYNETEKNGLKRFEKNIFNGVVYGVFDRGSNIYYFRTFLPYTLVNR